MAWVADESRTITIVAIGEGYASVTVSYQPQVTPGASTTVYADVKNTGAVDDTFQVSFNVDGAVTTYDLGTIAVGATKRQGHTFTMPTHDVTVVITGYHWGGAGAALTPGRSWIPFGIPKLNLPKLNLPNCPGWVANCLMLLGIGSPLVLVGGSILAESIKR